ncbi:MAG: transposase [Candidatus Methanoplasma sp.]|jgi:transposase|nr:transposase [Candidatus Methanoplasma sp.]
MAYNVVQKKGDCYYLYEAEGVWDPVKKNSVQKRRYLGKCDKDGNLLVSGRSLIRSCTFGSYYMMLEAAGSSGIYDSLVSSYGEKDADTILAVAILRIVCPGSLNVMNDKLEESFLPEMLDVESLTPSFLTRFLQRIGRDAGSRTKLFSSLAVKGGAVVFDTTALPTSSEELELAEIGRSYRRTSVRQENMGIVFSSEKGLPFMYKLYPGSVSDITMIRNLVQDVKDLGADTVEFVLDRGFFSEHNVMCMAQAEMGFTIPVPAGNRLSKECISSSVPHMDDPSTAAMLSGSVVRCCEMTVEYAGAPRRMLVFQDDDRRNIETRALYARLAAVEERLSGTEYRRFSVRTLTRSEKEICAMLEITEENGSIVTRRKRNAVTARANRCGRFVVMTSSDIPWMDIRIRYRDRNEIEGQFSQFKSDIGGGLTNLSDQDSAEGAVLTEFVSLMIRTELRNRMRKAGLLEKMQVPKAIAVMNKLKITRMGEKWRLNEITKEMRDLLSALGIPLPQDNY